MCIEINSDVMGEIAWNGSYSQGTATELTYGNVKTVRLEGEARAFLGHQCLRAVIAQQHDSHHCMDIFHTVSQCLEAAMLSLIEDERSYFCML